MSLFDWLVRRAGAPELPPLPPLSPAPNPLQDAIAHMDEARKDIERERRVDDLERRMAMAEEDILQLQRERGIRP